MGDGSCSFHFKHVQILSVVTIYYNKCTKVLTKWQKAAAYPQSSVVPFALLIFSISHALRDKVMTGISGLV